MMKKYIPSIVLMLATIILIGSFYGQAAMKHANMPEFRLETVAGDDAWVDSLALGAYYADEDDTKYLSVSKQGSFSTYKQSMLSMLQPTPNTYEAHLQQKYKRFMRGVHYYSQTIYEDDRYVVMAETIGREYNQDLFLNIRYLDSETGTMVKSITHQMFDVHRAVIPEVQMRGRDILVFVRTWDVTDHEQLNIFVDAYIFDTETGQFKEKETIIAMDGVSSSSELIQLQESVDWEPSEYIVYRKIEARPASASESNANQAAPTADQTTEEPASQSLYAYEVSTGTLEEIKLPETLQSVMVNLFDGRRLYFTDVSDHFIDVQVYDIRQESIVNEFRVDYNRTNGDAEVSMTVRNGHLYVMDPYADAEADAHVQVVDVDSGSVVYRGKVVQTNPNKTDDVRLFLSSLMFYKP